MLTVNSLVARMFSRVPFDFFGEILKEILIKGGLWATYENMFL